jgi:Family of unknown function (DUF6236)
MRGAIISPYSIRSNGGFSVLGDVPVLNTLPTALLYWDRLTVPIIAPGMIPRLEERVDFLIEQGQAEAWLVKEQSIIDLRSDYSLFVQDFAARVGARKERVDEIWSVISPAGGEGDLTAYLAREASSNRTQILEVTLREALPMPPPDTPYQDIIAFKKKRSDNLVELNDAIEELAVTLSGAESLEEAVRVGQHRITKALQELDAVLNEPWPKRLVGTLRANVGAIATGGVVGVAGVTSASVP